MKAVQLGPHEDSAGDARALDTGPIATGSAVVDIRYSATRVLDVAPAVLEHARIIDGRGLDPVTRAYKLLRTQVLQRLAKQRWQTIAVVSPSSAEGKTITAINLGIAIASAQQRSALLVDLDWRQPSVHKCFDYVPEHDVCSYLRGEQPLSAALINPGLPRFCFLPCADPVVDASEQLAYLGDFVAELKRRYSERVVLFDLPPLLATDDALSFLPLVDCGLLVVEEHRTQRDDITRALELIGPERLLGSVINKSRETLSEY
jgi:protein-tyrosine kinase